MAVYQLTSSLGRCGGGGAIIPLKLALLKRALQAQNRQLLGVAQAAPLRDEIVVVRPRAAQPLPGAGHLDREARRVGRHVRSPARGVLLATALATEGVARWLASAREQIGDARHAHARGHVSRDGRAAVGPRWPVLGPRS